MMISLIWQEMSIHQIIEYGQQKIPTNTMKRN